MDGINGLYSKCVFITFSLCGILIITINNYSDSSDAMTMLALALRWIGRRIHRVELPCGKDLHGRCWKRFSGYHHWADDPLFCKARLTCSARAELCLLRCFHC